MCSLPLEHEFIWFTIYAEYSLTIFRSGLTFLIMITSSVLIVWTLWKSKSKFSRDKNFRKELNLTRSLVLMDAFFIITSLPIEAYVFISFPNPFAYQILYVLSNFYNVILFIVFFYCNKVYRAILFKLFPKYVSK